MSKIKNSFGICVQQCNIIESITRECEQLSRGDLLRILEIESGDFYKSGTILVKLYNSDKNSFNSNLFECAKRFTAYVAIDLWPYMIGTNENHKRLRIYDERDLILGLKCGTEITIKSYESDLNADIRAEIKMIGAVGEVGIGNFIGLEFKNKPVKQDTLVTIYKKHFNLSTSLLLFRIEQLLDSLQDTGEQKTEVKLNLNTKSEVPSRQSLYPEKIHQKLDVYKHSYFTADDLDQANIKSPKSKIDLKSAAVDPIKSCDINSKATSSAIESNSLPILSQTRQPPNTLSLFDFLCDSNNPPYLFDCRPLLTSSNVSESKGQIINRSNQYPVYNEMEGSLISFPTEQENLSSAQLVDANINKKGAIPKNEAPAATKTNKGRYNQAQKKGRNIPSDIQFNKKPVSRMNQLERKPLQCSMCSRSFGNDTLVFKCNHCICIQCFCIKISSLIGTNRVQCPFTSGEDYSCNYQLQQFELKRLRQKMDEFFLSPKKSNSKPIAKVHDDNEKCYPKPIATVHGDNEEELYECKTDRCNGKWFLLKSSTANLFKCPICNINNCVKCKVIHDNMTCKEYKNTLAWPHMPLNNLVASEEDSTTESQQIPEVINTPAGNEMLIKCKNKNCSGIWFVSNNDKTQFFSCPVCDQFQEIRNRRYSSNFLRSKPTFSLDANSNQRYNMNASVGPDGFVNRAPKRNWTCIRCKFANFNSGFKCYKCRFLHTN